MYVLEITVMFLQCLHMITAGEAMLKVNVFTVKKVLNLLVVVSIYIITLGHSTHVHAQNDGVYIYSDIFKSNKVFLIDETKASVIIGDVGWSAKFCDPANGYVCFLSKYVAFAVPINQEIGEQQWVYGNFKFTNKGSGTIEFLNCLVNVQIIETTIDEVRYEYLYSKTYGVVAIGMFLQSGQSNTYFLKGVTGFGQIK